MPIRSHELGEFAPLVRFGERVDGSWEDQPDAYIRLRVKPAAGSPYSIGQVRSEQRSELIDQVIDRIVAANSTEPILVEFMGPGGKKMLDYTELPPLFEAYENAMQARLDVAKVQGDSQVLIAAFETIGRMAHTMMHQANGMHARWMDSEDRALEHRETVLDLIYQRPDAEPEDPEARKWSEIRKAFESVFGGPARDASALLRQAAEVRGITGPAAAGANGTSSPSSPPPTSSPSSAPTPAPEAQPANGGPSADELADTTLQWLGDILEHRPDLLTPERLAALAPHADKLRIAMAVLDAMGDQAPPPETPDAPPSDPPSDPPSEPSDASPEAPPEAPGDTE